MMRGFRVRTSFEADWVMRAITSGFFATVIASCALVLGYWLASLLGSNDSGAFVLWRWLYGLANNSITREAQTSLPLVVLLHFVAGIIWAFVYGVFAEPVLSGPGWRRGFVFSLAPWMLSLVVFLPLVGGGLLGLDLGAGPMPIVGNLIVHLVYGLALGHLYAIEATPSQIGSEIRNLDEILALNQANRVMAIGIVLGLVFGAIVGLIVGIVLSPGLSPLVGLLFGAVVGATLGALAGSISGLSPQ